MTDKVTEAEERDVSDYDIEKRLQLGEHPLDLLREAAEDNREQAEALFRLTAECERLRARIDAALRVAEQAWRYIDNEGASAVRSMVNALEGSET